MTKARMNRENKLPETAEEKEQLVREKLHEATGLRLIKMPTDEEID